MTQAEEFLTGEGAAWLRRNLGRYEESNDPVLLALDKYKITPEYVLEVGCADGARLKVLEQMWGCRVRGIDPGYQDQPLGYISKHVASSIPIGSKHVDTIIYGWCLYLCDPEDYFKIAAEGDRVLMDGGFLIVYDFDSPSTYKTPYKHKEGLFSHHYDFSNLWLCHPAYSLYGRQIQEETSVTILKKNMANAFPVKK